MFWHFVALGNHPEVIASSYNMVAEERLRRSIEHARVALQFAQRAKQRAAMLALQKEQLLAQFDEIDRRVLTLVAAWQSKLPNNQRR